jgi:hypothetical protein
MVFITIIIVFIVIIITRGLAPLTVNMDKQKTNQLIDCFALMAISIFDAKLSAYGLDFIIIKKYSAASLNKM